ncbi:MAG TPA: FtsL-like putative cell division protein [Bacteroidales bacterium]|nr:FtsL-like putative cell division protein [Bacteroidales bacterium]
MKKNKNNSTKVKSTFRGLLNGSIVASDFVRKQIPFIVVLFVLGLIYIANQYHAVSIFRETEQAKKELEDLRAEKIEIQSNLMTNSRRDKVLKLLEEKGSTLKEFSVPPIKITYYINE